jgi:hypothetical protein
MAPEAPDSSGRGAGRQGETDAWGAFGLMISGVAVWGGVGYGLSVWLGNQIFVMLGLLLGMGASLYLVWFKYGRA